MTSGILDICSVFLPSGGEHIVIYGVRWVWAGLGGVGGIAPPVDFVGGGGGRGGVVPLVVGNSAL